MKVDVKYKPELDPGFLPASLWNRAYQKATEPHCLIIAEGVCSAKQRALWACK